LSPQEGCRDHQKYSIAFKLHSKSERKEGGHEDWTDNKDMQKKMVIEHRGVAKYKSND